MTARLTGEEIKARAEKIADLLDDLAIEDAMDAHRAACDPIIYRRVRVAEKVFSSHSSPQERLLES